MRVTISRLKAFMAILTAAVCLCAPAPSQGEDILSADCAINEAVFDRDWKKYSDIDDRIDDLTARSWEAQQYAEAVRKIAELENESLLLQAEILLNGQVRREARELKKSLAGMMRANLIKSFFRLSFLTAHTIKTGYEVGKTYGSLLIPSAVTTLPLALAKIKEAADIVSKLMPKGSQAAEAVSQNAEGMQTVLETLASSDEEAAITLLGEALSLAEEKANAALPSWDTVPLSSEDISILESQYVNNRALDQFLQESYAADKLRSVRVNAQINPELRLLREARDGWEQREKLRVREMLIAGCLENKKKADDAPGRWELSAVRVFSLDDYGTWKYTLDSGGGTAAFDDGPNTLERDRDIFRMSFSWNEPEASYGPVGEVTLTITSRIDTWVFRGGPILAGGWIKANIGARDLTDKNGISAVEVGGSGGKITRGKDEKTVSIKLSGGRQGDTWVLGITTPSGHVYYHYEWQD